MVDVDLEIKVELNLVVGISVRDLPKKAPNVKTKLMGDVNLETKMELNLVVGLSVGDLPKVERSTEIQSNRGASVVNDEEISRQWIVLIDADNFIFAP